MTPPDRSGVIAITGAGRGIGAAIALELAGRGFTVACLTRAGGGIEEAPVPQPLAGRILAEQCDVTDGPALAGALERVAARPGGLRGLVNNAGVHTDGPSAALATDDLEAVFRTNVFGLFAASREAYPWLKARGGGMILNLGSFFDRMGVPRNLAYASSKAAVAAITRCLAVEWAREGITVLNLAPGYVETSLNRAFLTREKVRDYLIPRIPVGRTGTPQEVARLAGALFAEELPFLTGETIYMDGGQGINH